ncbi:hypothetical protein ACWDSD_36570 [Streptomyces spiralis]
MKTAERSERAARLARLRQDRLQACSAFAAAANRLRRSANDRWFRRQESPDGRESFEVADGFYAARTEAWQAYYAVRLVLADPDVKRLSQAVINTASQILEASDHSEVRLLRERTSSLVEEFVDTASRLLDAGRA